MTVKRVRRWVAHKIWDVASRIWVEPDEDRGDWAYWSMDCTFLGTDADAHKIFDAMTGLGSSTLGLHESDTRFVVGGMHREEIED